MEDRSFLGGRPIARCMGGSHCNHIVGTCTATACSKHGLRQPDGKCAMCELDKALDELPEGTCLLCKGTGERLFQTVDGGYMGDCECRATATETQLVQETDTIAVFKDKFAGSLESMADDMDGAREVFAADHEIVGAFLATASWLRRSGKAIRDSKVL
jgi:hypothetical protein